VKGKRLPLRSRNSSGLSKRGGSAGERPQPRKERDSFSAKREGGLRLKKIPSLRSTYGEVIKREGTENGPELGKEKDRVV